MWVQFIARLWPVAHRYRVLLALRRGKYGEAIHGLLGPVDELLADLVKGGQDTEVFAQHLSAGILSQVAYGVVFALADSNLSNQTLGARPATTTSLLMLGVPETRAIALVGDQPRPAVLARSRGASEVLVLVPQHVGDLPQSVTPLMAGNRRIPSAPRNCQRGQPSWTNPPDTPVRRGDPPPERTAPPPTTPHPDASALVMVERAQPDARSPQSLQRPR